MKENWSWSLTPTQEFDTKCMKENLKKKKEEKKKVQMIENEGEKGMNNEKTLKEMKKVLDEEKYLEKEMNIEYKELKKKKRRN